MAAVVVSVEGAIGGAAVLALDPEDALRWIRRPGEPARLEDFVCRAGALLDALLDALGSAVAVELPRSAASFAEESVVAILLGTHAPSDTLLLSMRVALGFGAEQRPAELHVLMDPKVASALLPRLAAA